MPRAILNKFVKKQTFNLWGFDGSVSGDTKRKWKNTASFAFFDSGAQISGVRISSFYLVLLFVLLVFLGRLFLLSVVSADRYKDLAENNRIKLIEIEAERGNILDRRGQVIAESLRSFALVAGGKETLITKEQVNDLEKEGLAGENFEGELGYIKQAVLRKYTLGLAASHVLGYISKVTEEEVSENPTISIVNSTGKIGVEEVFDSFLQGRVGKRLIEVDASGNNVSILGEEVPQKGRDVQTTIDANLQKVAFDALTKQVEKVGTKRGAVVIQNPNTGEVLALASSPSFNAEDIGKYVTDENKPFFNRAIQGVYPPGSVFKISSAFAGLENGAVDQNTEIEDVGFFELGGQRFSNWYFNQYGRKDGLVKIDRAIARSNDIYFYRVAEKVGIDNLRKMAISLGFGQKTGIDLPAEAFGLVPDGVWKKSTYGEDWYLGDTMHLGIGQGFMLTTPLQINSMISYAASGKLIKPYVVSKISGEGGNEVNFTPQVKTENLVNAQNLAIVRDGMKKACETGGTAFPFFNTSYRVGCKTGTAERELGNPHAWFSAYAPLDDPQITITVLVENGGEGSSVAAPVAKEILDWWNRNYNN